MPAVETYLVQIVRDPRAVAYSWQRRKASPGEGKRQQMMTISPATIARGWVLVNATAEAVRRARRPASILVRYEDFVESPREWLDRILELLGEPTQPAGTLKDGSVHLSGSHTAGGNPDRFRTGTVRIERDIEWLDSQRAWDRFVSTALALPLLWRYGYPTRPRRQYGMGE
jgi:hypothetical protein